MTQLVFRNRFSAATMLLALALAGCQSGPRPSVIAAGAPEGGAGQQSPRPSTADVLAASSLAISINLAKVCPGQFALTRDKDKLAEAERLKRAIGSERFNKGLSVLQPPKDCKKARDHAAEVKLNLPFSVIK